MTVLAHLDPIHAIDFYKSGHIYQYPKDTEMVVSNGTPRSFKLFKSPLNVDGVVVFGMQGFLKWFSKLFDERFFNAPKHKVLAKYKRRMDKALGKGTVGIEHIEALHDLGYLPIAVYALPEGSLCPEKVPVYVMYNTVEEFFWVVNYLETIFSAETWKPTVAATIAHHYKRIVTQAAIETGVDVNTLDFQCHDFSFRGMSGWHDAAATGSGHLLSFTGTDTVPALDFLEEYYDAEDSFIAGSVPATEHSVMCMGSKEDEKETFRRLIEDLYPNGFVSIVSDTWDFWQVMTEYTVALKDKIMAREGRVVFRPDSGNPVHIIAGYRHSGVEYADSIHTGGYAEEGMEVVNICGQFHPYVYRPDGSRTVDGTTTIPDYEVHGAIHQLWEVFGGTYTKNGYRVLDTHVGLIYGDSITLERAQEILKRLKEGGYASSNIVFGVGSYTYQYNTRDTAGFAVKATAGKRGGEFVEIFKEPKTDVGGVKKSARGWTKVLRDDAGKLYLKDQVSMEEFLEDDNELKALFIDGEFVRNETLDSARAQLKEVLNSYF